MKSVDIFSIDRELAEDVAKIVTAELKNRGMNSSYVDTHATTFAKLIRVLKTYTGAFPIGLQSLIFLDAAREASVQDELLAGNYKSDILIVNPHSFLLETASCLFRGTDVNIKKILTKHIIRKFSLRPSYIFFLNLDKAYLNKKRKKDLKTKRQETSMRGNGLRARISSTKKAIPLITKKFKSDIQVLDLSGTETAGEIAEKILKHIDETQNWLSTHEFR